MNSCSRTSRLVSSAKRSDFVGRAVGVVEVGERVCGMMLMERMVAQARVRGWVVDCQGCWGFSGGVWDGGGRGTCHGVWLWL